MSSQTVRSNRIPLLAVAGLVALLAFFGISPAALAGEGGGHGDTQGWSHSNPDGAPGVDKPYGADGYGAGSQGEDDFDGNNGCGNDDDRADDNNGRCEGKGDGDAQVNDNANDREGDRTEREVRGDDADADDADDADDVDDPDDPEAEGDTDDGPATVTNVLSAGEERALTSAPAPATAGTDVTAASTEEARVLGVSIERDQGAVALARTGLPLMLLASAGIALIAGGLLLRRR